MAVATAAGSSRADFEVHLDVYAGPFDVLLGLISKHKLDVTEVALAQVTDEFVAFVRSGGGFDLEQTTSFLVVAATLLDLKAARLLPGLEVDDEDDLALLEARDLLFARLLQYRAYKQVAEWMRGAMAAEATWRPRTVSLPDSLVALMPEVRLDIGPHGLAILAAAAMAPKTPPVVDVDHLHTPRVSVREQAALLSERLVTVGAASFRALCADCEETIEVVARFLALLELFREGRVRFEQVSPLGDLRVSWTGDRIAEALPLQAAPPAMDGSA
jgi:segregation and condensation protein A